MKTIWKYPLLTTDLQTLMLPEEAEILTAQVQDDGLVLWALVDGEAIPRPRHIEILGTGQAIFDGYNPQRKYINTVQISLFVWHVFERL